ncbi:MAG: response regulator [Deltaproteobacteria bacterium]|nr:response regulator [Deltaproteobacteria bacterium]
MNMKWDSGRPGRLSELCRQATSVINLKTVDPDTSSGELRGLLYELREHQIELEMQNEELRRAQEELVDSRDRYSSLYDFAPVGYVTLSHNAIVLEANLTLADMLGVERKDLEKNALHAFVIPDDQDIFYRHRIGIFKSKQRNTCRIRMRRKDAEPLWVEMDSILIEADNKSDTRLRTVISDITEQIKTETELRYHKTNLEELVEKRTEELRQSQKMEVVGQLVGGVAHDFNNILTGINGYSEMILDSLNPQDPLQEDVKEIFDAGKRAAALINQLLSFSRKQVVDPQIVQPNEIIAHSKQMLARIIGEDIELEFLSARNTWPIKIDPAQLDQVLINLVVNCRDAMPNGGKLTIEISNVSLDQYRGTEGAKPLSGDFLKLRVSDTGHGMNDEVRRHVFEPFFSTKPKGQGTGLGLATVYGIMRQNRGAIRVESQVGAGTTFHIYFQRAQIEAELTSAKQERGRPIGTETVLLVEDERLVRTLTHKMLIRQGYSVLEAADPFHAITLLEENPQVDLLLTDVIMPKMSGKDLLGHLKQHAPRLSALFMSGYNDEAIVNRGLLDPATNILQKPFSLVSLAQKVREVLDLKRTNT